MASAARSRAPATVVLVSDESVTMSDSWIDQLELQRDTRATFTVMARKHGDDHITGRRRWRDVGRRGGLRAPESVRAALLAEAEMLGVEIDWSDALPRIATIDWVTAAVIARKIGRDAPPLPAIDAMLAQRSLRTLRSVKVGAEWGYDMHCVKMSFEQWLRVLCGETFCKETRYDYEGRRSRAWWKFDGRGHLRVLIDMDGDGYPTGEGWIGRIQGLDMVEGPQVDGDDLARIALEAVVETG
jgi:hypothetical protein